jgi:hypothetical protein
VVVGLVLMGSAAVSLYADRPEHGRRRGEAS